VLLDDGDPRGFGAALAWAHRRHIERLDVLVETATHPEAAGIVARRAALLRRSPGVAAVHGRELRPAIPLGFAAPAPAPPEALAFVDALRAHGVDPIVEHGVVTGEILGLEVVRVVADTDERGWRLAVGVGHHDREARAEMRVGQDPFDALDEVVATVRARRRAGVARHPANALARERWLRAVVVARPDLVGASILAPLAAPLPRLDLRRSAPAPAAGRDDAGRAVVVVCSTGVDVDLVPTAADARLGVGSARLVLAVPRGDDYPVTRALASALEVPAEVVVMPADWPALVGYPADQGATARGAR
jgi:hypothetical protein